MTNELTDAWNRLLPPHQLFRVAALLNMPRMEEAVTRDAAPQGRQQASLYAKIAEWAQLSAQAATRKREPGRKSARSRFAYLVEYTEDHANGWSRAPGEHVEALESWSGAPEAVAPIMLHRYLTYLAEHRDDYQLWLVDSLSLRVSLWDVDASTVTARRVPAPGKRHASGYASALQLARISPHAVEVRTPIQVHAFLDQFGQP
ncbi:hypothetical protein HII36_33525 [Nonomuraea sp. NN258]|uniref:hypothetical protein n=1 Tax=Nonomuraea antri TaxID=2730852 RepID=UPI001567EF90|nr:hypothetical protein [Nonomuraea antri]NRQ36721.1 hypothetical protein [Nonomuraea antri]